MTAKPKAAARNGKSRTSPVQKPIEPVRPLFRKSDWLTFAVTIAVIWIVYFLTLAPELTLEDSGELVTGSYYAGIPHPPGYPVWTIYSWLWTVLVPVGNIAWRVALAEATAGAVSCGLIALLVSRGSSLLIQGIAQLNQLTGKWEIAICSVSGLGAGLLMGLDAFMWHESVAVNRIAVSSVPWLMLVLVCLLRWIYAPHQQRYLYWALFLFGICFTTHQSLIVASIGIEVLIAARNPRLGRDIFLGNGMIYLLYNCVLLFTGQHIFHNIGAKPGLLLLFNGIGAASLIASGWLAMRSRGLLTEWKPVLIMGLLWLLGVSFYFYMPLSCMTNPPMQWDYPRTVDGFMAALSRGQYEQPNPTNVVTEFGRFAGQLAMLVGGVGESFTWVGVFVALVPFAFVRQMQKPEQAWLIGLLATYLCLGVLLIILLNPTPDRASAELVKVFFNASHAVVACLIGYGWALTSAYMATNYTRFRRWGLVGGITVALLALFGLFDTAAKHFFGPGGQIRLGELPHFVAQAFHKDQFGLPVFAGLLLVGIALAFVFSLVIYRSRAPLGVALCLFAAMPLYSSMAHWFQSNQRGHMFGYWFGHDMFTPPFKGSDNKPLFPEMSRNAILFGGTDPGRFCPTYMIFCESFTPHRCQPKEDQAFDRRDVYIITQNALADPPYQNYIRAHYDRSEQIDPPFFRELFRRVLGDKEYETNMCACALSPLDKFFSWLGDKVERRRRASTSWFRENDFVDIRSLADKLRPRPQQDPLSKFIYDNLSPHTRELLAGSEHERSFLRALSADLNHVLAGEMIGPAALQQVKLSQYVQDFVKESPQGDSRVRLNRLLLEEAYPTELARSDGGVYPDREIHTPTTEESARCFDAYIQDVKRRTALNQLRAGEDIKVVGDRMQVSGQGSVMAINGLIAKVIFDRNPQNEFFLEESMAIDWMYPHLTPSGIIMKINRQPLASIPEDILRRDHEFWKQYSHRLTGDVVQYETPVKQLADWIEKTYVNRNFEGFTGDRKFIFDIDAQRSFSKLRSAIAGVYAWRLSPQCPSEYRPKSPEEFQRLLQETDFSFRQALAFCPWSPEAAFHYVNLLLQTNRLDDAILVAKSYLKLDPFNARGLGVLDTLRNLKKQQTAAH
jgi:hypothetical protein